MTTSLYPTLGISVLSIALVSCSESSPPKLGSADSGAPVDRPLLQPDMDPLSAGAMMAGAGVMMAGEPVTGGQAGGQAGEPVTGGQAGDQAGDQAGIEPSAGVMTGGEAGAGGSAVTCEPRFEARADGSCAPIPCPEGASGAPDCSCDEGLIGSVRFDETLGYWLGVCYPDQSSDQCGRRSINSYDFEATSDPAVGELIYQRCAGSPGMYLYQRVSIVGEVVYVYSARGAEQREVCLGLENPDMVSVEAWPHSGGLLTGNELFYVEGLTVMADGCVFQVLGTFAASADELETVYLAPFGLDCDSGSGGEMSVEVSCGRGVCASTGRISCEGGAWEDSCVPGPANERADESCNGLDNDCDGLIDESFEASPTTCGQGACQSQGLLSCSSSGPVDSCQPGRPSVEVFTNGVDEDCDGLIDEGAPACELITIDQFVSTNSYNEGTTIKAVCMVEQFDTSYMRWAYLPNGQISLYDGAGVGACPGQTTDHNTFNTWSYEGGSINQPGLFDSGIDHSDGGCLYDVIGQELFSGRELGSVFFAPKR